MLIVWIRHLIVGSVSTRHISGVFVAVVLSDTMVQFASQASARIFLNHFRDRILIVNNANRRDSIIEGLKGESAKIVTRVGSTKHRRRFGLLIVSPIGIPLPNNLTQKSK